MYSSLEKNAMMFWPILGLLGAAGTGAYLGSKWQKNKLMKEIYGPAYKQASESTNNHMLEKVATINELKTELLEKHASIIPLLLAAGLGAGGGGYLGYKLGANIERDKLMDQMKDIQHRNQMLSQYIQLSQREGE